VALGATAQALSRGEGVAPANVLVLVADDLGADQLALYGKGADYPSTPVLDGLAAGGVLFRSAWTNPICSPSRASLMTGRYAFRTGVGNGVTPHEYALQPEEFILPEMLDAGAPDVYSHAVFGKWHLGSEAVGGVLAPNLAGWGHFSGTTENLGQPGGYFSWPKVVDGVVTTSTTYATTDVVDSALAWIAGATEPWLVYVSFHAPHAPFHAPPEELHSVDLSSAGPPGTNPRPYYKAMVEALDTELGRLLEGLGEQLANTHVIFVGDNGTPDEVAVSPSGKHKGTVFEGGVHVPLIVSGPAVSAPGTETDALVVSTDLFATVAELAGVDLAQVQPAGFVLDSVSWVPYLADPLQPALRPWIFTEAFKPNGPFGAKPETKFARAIRDERYKLMVDETSHHRLFDLLEDPEESLDLLAGGLTPEEQATYLQLAATLYELLRIPPAQATPYGCGVNPPGSFVLASGLPALGSEVTLAVDNPLGTQATGLAAAYLARNPQPSFPCGIQVPGWGMSGAGAPGELLFDLASLLFTVGELPWEVGAPALVHLSIPADTALAGLRLYAQGVLLDLGPGALVPSALTEALELRIEL